jgi:hypothetical protein
MTLSANRLGCAALLLFSLSCGAQEAAPQGSRLLFLGVAYDEAPPKGQTVDHYNYAPDNFSTMFRTQSKELFREIVITTLKGDRATRSAVLRSLRSLSQEAQPQDLVFLYWGTHGATEDGDWGANLPGGDGISGSELKAELAKLSCPAVVAISTCGSGGFIRPDRKTVDLPSNVTAFAACRPQQTTNNELDITLLEALAGFGDADGSGDVSIQEVRNYVPRRYRMLSPEDDLETLPVLGQGDGDVFQGSLTRVTGQHVAALHDGAWYGATILNRKNGALTVRYLGWDPVSRNAAFFLPDELVPLDRVDLAGGEPPVEVEWNGTWYPALILGRTSQGRFRIHYIGYPESDDETVPAKRIRYPFGSSSP